MDKCDGPARYPSHDHGEVLASMEREIKRRGLKGFYRPHLLDGEIRWVCRRHFLEREFGLVPAKCPECAERFAFDNDHLYADDDEDEVRCPHCTAVVYSSRRESVWRIKESVRESMEKSLDTMKRRAKR